MTPIGGARSGIVGSGGSAIPDSVVTQFEASTFSTGDPTWNDDVGSNDMSMTGDPQKTTFSDGTEAIEGDGTDDHGSFSFPTAFDGNSIETSSVEWTMQYTDDQTQAHRLFGLIDSGLNNQRFVTYMDIHFFGGGSPGHITAVIEDDNGNRLDISPANNPNLDDGSKHTIGLVFNDLTQNDVQFFIDGSSVSTDTDFDGNPTAFTSWTENCYWWDANNSSSEKVAKVGKIRLHDTNISSLTI